MGKNTDLVKKALTLLEQGKIPEASLGFSDDFVYSGFVPRPMNKPQFLENMQSLVSAIPDWRFNMSDAWEQGDSVRMKFHVTGSNTAPIAVPAFSLELTPPSGRSFALPEEPVEAVVKSGKIVSMTAAEVPGGGVSGILKQLEVELPCLVLQV